MAKMRTRGTSDNTQDQPGLRVDKVGPRYKRGDTIISGLTSFTCNISLCAELTHIYWNLMPTT